jgi:hypothetical protein
MEVGEVMKEKKELIKKLPEIKEIDPPLGWHQVAGNYYIAEESGRSRALKMWFLDVKNG